MNEGDRIEAYHAAIAARSTTQPDGPEPSHDEITVANRRDYLQKITHPETGEWKATPGSGGVDDVGMYDGERYVIVSSDAGMHYFSFRESVPDTTEDDFDPYNDSTPVALIDLDTGATFSPEISVRWVPDA